MSRAQRFLCGTPEGHCTGVRTTTPQPAGAKTHSSRKEAKSCYIRYLKMQGYHQSPTNASVFHKDGSPALVLARDKQFGSLYRAGKEGRVMPALRTGGSIIDL